MRKNLYQALLDYADEPNTSNRLRLHYEIRQEQVDATGEEETQLAEIADALEDKQAPAHEGYYF